MQSRKKHNQRRLNGKPANKLAMVTEANQSCLFITNKSCDGSSLVFRSTFL
jgi:hypothetical protein